MSDLESCTLLKRRDAARRLAVSERTLQQWTIDGVMPAVRVGQLVRYHVPDLLEFIDSRKVNAGAATPETVRC